MATSGRKIISDSGRGIRGGVRVSRKCSKVGEVRVCIYNGTYKGKRYLITNDAMASLGLLRRIRGKLEVKIGSKWVRYK